ncbi:MAG TPA: hypothetical protein ENH33_07260 [Actinobacteria bacterium]|nr:hypothetical protein [Actinomycetota bacterium]
MSLFDRHTDDQILEIAKTAKPSGADKTVTDRALDYLAGRMLVHVRADLSIRYPSTQGVSTGQEMQPQALPLVERFIGETANVYDRGAKRRMVDGDGNETEATRRVTDELNRLADEMALDESLHMIDQVQSLVESCGGWAVVKRGVPQLRLAYPHEIHTVANDSPEFDANDQRDYRAYIIGLGKGGKTNRFAWVARGETAYYEANSADSPKKIDSNTPNPWSWPQVDDTGEERPDMPTSDLPVMPLVLWHRRPPMRAILPQADATIAHVAHELNLSWSALMDVFRMQSFSTLVLTGMQSDEAFQLHGARFPIKPGIEGGASYINSSVDYGQLVAVLVDYQRLCALALRMNPNDFSLDQKATMSGFAKLVDSLPKIEARHSRVRRLKRTEETGLWPVLGSILIWQNKIGEEAHEMRMVTDFPDLAFPLSPEEEAKKFETDFRYNLDTPAHVLARRRGISVGDAKKAIIENAEINEELGVVEGKIGAKPEPAAPVPLADNPPPQRRPGSNLGALIKGRGQRAKP